MTSAGWVVTVVATLVVTATHVAACRTEACPLMCQQIQAAGPNTVTLTLNGVECAPRPSEVNGMINLDNIIITNCSISSLGVNYFEDETHNLKLFRITACELSSLGDELFSGHTIFHLDLSGNKLAYVSQLSLSFMVGVGLLNVSNNAITAIDSGLVMNSVTTLDISHNKITRLPSGWYDMFKNVVTLNASHNLISEIENGAFPANSKTKTADFSYNLLGTKPLAETLFYFAEFDRVDLSNNPLTLLPGNFFAKSLDGQPLSLDVYKTRLAEPPGAPSVFGELYVDASVFYGHRAAHYFSKFVGTLKVYDPKNPDTPQTYQCTAPGSETGEDCSKLARTAPSSTHGHSTWGLVALVVGVPGVLGLAALALWHHRKTHGGFSLPSRKPKKASRGGDTRDSIPLV